MPRPRFFPEAERLTLTPVNGLSVDAASGAVMANVPLPVPPLPERFGIEHLVGIQWLNGLQDGPLGPGWHLGLGHVTPDGAGALTPVGASRWRVEFPGGGGELVEHEGSWYPRIQRTYFRAERIEPSGNWRLWNASGVRFEFFGNEGSHRWDLTSIVDRHDNRVEYVWEATPDTPCGPTPTACVGDRVVRYIRYFSNTSASVEPNVELEFVWVDREEVAGVPRAFSTARQGELVYTSRRLGSIQVKTRTAPGAGGFTRAYDIVFIYTAHDEDPTAVLLGQIEVHSPDGATTRVLRRFGYASSLVALAAPILVADLPNQVDEVPVQADDIIGDYGVRAADVNGDGYADLFVNLREVLFGDPQRPGRFVRPVASGYNEFLATLPPWVPEEHLCLVNGAPLQRGNCGWMLLDVNGDTRPDLLHLGQPNPPLAPPMTNQLFLNTGTTWTAAPAWQLAQLRANYTARVRVGTFTPPWEDVALPLRNAVSVHDEVPQDEDHPESRQIRDAGLRLGDVNGDGLLDLVRIYNNWQQPHPPPEDPIFGYRRQVVGVWLQRRDASGAVIGWDPAYDPVRTTALVDLASSADPVFFAYNDGRAGFDLMDVNGDGLADLVRLLHDSKRVLHNTGLGWRDAPGYTNSATAEDIYKVGSSTSSGPPLPGWDGSRANFHLDQGLVPIDYNNDGLIDWVQSLWELDANHDPSTAVRLRAWINTGDGWARDPRMETVIQAPATRIALAWQTPVGPISMGWMLGDFNGDLRTDFFQLRTETTQQQLITTLGQIPRLLAREVNEFGGTQLLEFMTPAMGVAAGWELQDGDVFNVPSVTVVREQKRFDCSPAPGTSPGCASTPVDFEVTNFTYHHAQVGAHGFELFGEVREEHNPSATGSDRVTHKRFFTETREACRGDFGRLQQLRADGSLAREDVQHFSWSALPGGRSRCALQRTQRFLHDVGLAAPIESELLFESDLYGNITSITDNGFLHVGDDGLVRTTTWASSADGHVVNLRVRDEDRTHFTNQLLAATRYRYDDLPEGSAGAGVLTHQERMISTGVWASTSFTTDALGRVTHRTDPDGVTDALDFAPGSVWVTQHTHGFGTAAPEFESMTPDPRNGRPTAFTDRNGRSTSFARDTFGLLDRVTRPGDVGSTVGSLDFVLYQRGDPTAQYLETRRPLDGRTLVLREYLDGFGRVKRVEDLGAAAEGERRVIDYTYDLRGNLHQAGVQRHHAATPRQVTLDYDPLGRLVSVTRPGGFTTTRSFLGTQRTVTDFNGHSHTETLNWRDQKVLLEEIVSGAPRITTWTYDPLGRLVGLLDGGGAQSTFGYDMRGAPTSHSDPATGATTYDNSPAGRRRFTHRADGTHVETVYDALGRRIKVRSSDGVQTVFTWGTDALTRTVGRVARVDTATARTDFEYDDEGRETLRRLTLDGHRYPITFGYARNGERTSATMPGGRVITWLLDDFGRPREARDGSRALASAVLYNDEDRITSLKYGNDLQGTFGYDAVTSRPASATLGGGSLMNATFGFDANGNVLYTDDPARPTTPRQDFQYDEANELVAETVGSTTEPYAYDSYGNLTRMADRGYDMDPTHPHRVACVRTWGTTTPCGSDVDSYAVTYDGRGNVTSRGDLSFTHDLLNRVTQIFQGATLVQETTYDGLGGVAAEARNGASSVHVGGWFEQHGTFHVIHVPFGAERIASIRVDGFVGEPVMAMSTNLRDWDRGRASAAGRARGLFWGLLAACVAAAVLSFRARRRIASTLVDAVRTARRRTRWWSPRPWKAAALALVALLAFARQDVLVSIAHADPLPTTTTYYHNDMVQSATLLTDDAGVVARRTDHRPYGEVRASSGGGGVGFVHAGFQFATATEAEDVSHMGARHYDAELGRFLEADGVQPDLDNPHQLNRYAFAGGNPVSVTDPSGHGWLDALHILFVAAVAILVAVLTLGAAVPMLLVVAATLVSAVAASLAFSGASYLIAQAMGSSSYITLTRALVIGVVIGLLVAGAVLAAGGSALAAQPILGNMAQTWAVDVAVELVSGLAEDKVTDGDKAKTLLKWGLKFAFSTGAGLMFGAVPGIRELSSTAQGAIKTASLVIKVVKGTLTYLTAVMRRGHEVERRKCMSMMRGMGGAATCP